MFALTATAGALGWGFAAATLQQQGPPKHRVMLFDSKTPNPQYATMEEMEEVGQLVFIILLTSKFAMITSPPSPMLPDTSHIIYHIFITHVH